MSFSYCIIVMSLVGSLSACSSLSIPVPSADKISLSRASEYNVQLGLAYLKTGDIPRAKYKLLLALRQAPRSAIAKGAMAYFLAQTGEIRQAERYYLAAIKLTPNSGTAHNQYGSFLCQQKRYVEAEAHFLRAVQDTSHLNLAEIYENAGICMLRCANREKAIHYFKRALEKDPARRTVIQMIHTLHTKNTP